MPNAYDFDGAWIRLKRLLAGTDFRPSSPADHDAARAIFNEACNAPRGNAPRKAKSASKPKFECPFCGHRATFHLMGDTLSCGKCGLWSNLDGTPHPYPTDAGPKCENGYISTGGDGACEAYMAKCPVCNGGVDERSPRNCTRTPTEATDA